MYVRAENHEELFGGYTIQVGKINGKKTRAKEKKKKQADNEETHSNA